jgi:foldase protein PrsA
LGNEVKLQIANYKLQIIASLLLLAVCTASGQVASHAPTAVQKELNARTAAGQGDFSLLLKPVARVNGAVLLELDLVRMMFAMFPYARQHNGFPQALEPEIRKGALEMIIFEELLFQEAKRRKLTISPARLARAETDFRKQFSSPAEYRRFLKLEVNGSRPAMREKIRRSLLIEQMLKTEVQAKAKVSAAEAKAFYNRNSKNFQHGETFHIQSISILPPNRSADVLKEARRRAEEALKAAKAAKTYREFGLLAERMSDDDFRVKLGDHKPQAREQLPPEIVKAVLALQPGQVSELIQLGDAYTIIRLIAHVPAGKSAFAEVKAKVQADLEKERTEQLRAALGKKLRQNAQIERL